MASTATAIRVWRPAGLEGVEAKRGVGVTHAHASHWHDELHLVFIDGGAGVLSYPRNALPTVAGSFFVVPPGEVHANHSTVETGCSFRTVNLRMDGQGCREGFGSLLAKIPVTVTAEREVIRRFLDLHRTLSQADSGLASESALLEFLEVLGRRCAIPRPSPGRAERESLAVRKAREYLHDHMDRNVSLIELALVTNLSRYHLVRVFRRAMGLPPHAYLNGIRIQRACRLLRRGWSPATIAGWLGFADQAHFTRHFRRVVGIPPHLYQRQSKNVQDPITRLV